MNTCLLPLMKVAMNPSAAHEVQRTLASGTVAEGPRAGELERTLTQTLPHPLQVVLVNSCTSALDLALDALELQPGDAVLTTPMTCVATNIMLLHRRLRIIWADVESTTGFIDVTQLEQFASAHLRAVITVDWAGELSPISELRPLGVPIIQDAAHSMAPSAVAGSFSDFGDLVCWSFQAVKHLTAGDGGALVTGSSGFADAARKRRWFGLDRTIPTDRRLAQDIEKPGYKYQMNDIAASIGLANLPLVRANIDKARSNAKVLDDNFVELGIAYRPARESSRWLYTLIVDSPSDFAQFMHSQGIEARQAHRRNDTLTCFRDSLRPLPGLDRYSSSFINIPVGWWLSESDLSRMIDAVRAYCSTRRSGGRTSWAF